jgi:hypothetical protein
MKFEPNIILIHLIMEKMLSTPVHDVYLCFCHLTTLVNLNLK